MDIPIVSRRVRDYSRLCRVRTITHMVRTYLWLVCYHACGDTCINAYIYTYIHTNSSQTFFCICPPVYSINYQPHLHIKLTTFTYRSLTSPCCCISCCCIPIVTFLLLYCPFRPGAVAVAQGKRYVNCYIGHGVMYEPKRYTPDLPTPLMTEWAPPTEDEEGGVVLVEQPDVKVWYRYHTSNTT